MNVVQLISDAPAHRVVTIGEIAEVVTKGTTPTSVGFAFEQSGINFVKVESLAANGAFIERKFGKISSECHDALRRSQLQAGDILFSIAGALGRTAIVDKSILPANTNQAIAIIRLKVSAEVDRRYLLYALSPTLMIEQIEQHKGGVAQQNLSLGQLKEFRLPLPPLEEQERIVAVLDQAFAALDRARALAQANMADAEELLSAQLRIALDQMQALHGLSNLGSHVDFRNGFAFKSSKFVDAGQPVVRISNIQSGAVTLERVVYARQQDYREDLSKYLVEEGELLIAMSGATTGKIGFNKTGMTLLQNQRVGKFAKTSSINLDYLAFFLETKVAEHLDISAGAAQPNLSTKQISEVMLPIPQKEEQNQFVARMGFAKTRCAAAQGNYQKQLDAISDLRQSLLHKAFAGELT